MDGWSENEFKQEVSFPAYKPTDDKACFLVASGDLPFRNEWMMLMHTKFQTPEVATEFQLMLVLHAQTFNPSGQPYTGEHATLKRNVETSEQKPDAEEIPSVTGAPDTKEKFFG